MSGKGDPLTGCVGIVVFVVFGAIISAFGWVIWQFAKWIHNNPETAWKIVLGTILLLTSPIWLPSIVISVLVVLVCRDLVVFNWSEDASSEAEKVAVVVWIFVIPAIMLLLWGVVWSRLSATPMTPETVFLMVVPAVVAIGAYYCHYFVKPPTKDGIPHPSWPRFVAAEEDMKFDSRVWFINKHGRLKLWWYRVKKQVIEATVEVTTRKEM